MKNFNIILKIFLSLKCSASVCGATNVLNYKSVLQDVPRITVERQIQNMLYLFMDYDLINIFPSEAQYISKCEKTKYYLTKICNHIDCFYKQTLFKGQSFDFMVEDFSHVYVISKKLFRHLYPISNNLNKQFCYEKVWELIQKTPRQERGDLASSAIILWKNLTKNNGACFVPLWNNKIEEFSRNSQDYFIENKALLNVLQKAYQARMNHYYFHLLLYLAEISSHDRGCFMEDLLEQWSSISSINDRMIAARDLHNIYRSSSDSGSGILKDYKINKKKPGLTKQSQILPTSCQ